MLIVNPRLHKEQRDYIEKLKMTAKERKEEKKGIMVEFHKSELWKKVKKRKGESSSINHSCITPTLSRKFRV